MKPAGTLTGEHGAARARRPPIAARTRWSRCATGSRTLEVRATEQAPVTRGGIERPAGSFVIPRRRTATTSPTRSGSAIEPLGLDGDRGVRRMPDVASHDVDLPRLAIFSTWGNTQEVGWVRHAFDQFEVPFDLIYKERVRQGSLRGDYDVILVPNQGRGGAKSLVYDVESMRGKPLAYTKSDRVPDARRLRRVGRHHAAAWASRASSSCRSSWTAGGVLVTLGVVELSAGGVRSGTQRSTPPRPTAQFYAPGPDRAGRDPASRITRSSTATPTRRCPCATRNGPLLQVPRDRSRRAGPDAVRRRRRRRCSAGSCRGRTRSAIARRSSTRPRARAASCCSPRNPCYRWQNHGEFGMLFNAILHWNDRPVAEPSPPAPKPTSAAAAAPAR